MVDLLALQWHCKYAKMLTCLDRIALTATGVTFDTQRPQFVQTPYGSILNSVIWYLTTRKTSLCQLLNCPPDYVMVVNYQCFGATLANNVGEHIPVIVRLGFGDHRKQYCHVLLC